MMGPRFILSKKAALKKYEIIKSLCDRASYSYKTNPEVGDLLYEETDTELSIHSLENTERICDKSRIWLFAQGWDKEEIRQFYKLGIRKIVVDNEADLKLLLDFIRDTEYRIDLLLRMRMKEMTVATGKYFVYGMYSDQINRLIPILRNNKSISKLGIHFHRKSQNTSEWSLRYELEQSLSEDTLKAIDILNIGGGFPVKYKNYTNEVLDSITKKIRELHAWLKNNSIELMMEPGRFIAAPSVRLKTTIKNIYDDNIIINCSVYNSCLDSFVAHIRLLIQGEATEAEYKAGKAKKFTIKGNIPCSMDIFRYRIFLNDPQVGDTITFLNAGAYNFTTDMCNVKKLKTIIVEDFEDADQQ